MKDRALLRKEFPVLSECVYLNSNSTGAFPRGGEEVLRRYWETLADWRDDVWERWWQELHETASDFGTLIGAPLGTVVTDVNLTSLLARLATSLDFSTGRRRVITTDLEFPTMEVLWRSAARLGAELVVIPSNGVEVDQDALHAAIDERTRLVCVSHATFGTGALLDAEALVFAAHRVGAWVALDAYQSVGVVPIDVTEIGVDFLLGGAHKWLSGAPDLGFLYVRPALLRWLRPVTGWMSLDNPLTFAPSETLTTTARRFASGTPAVLPAIFSRVGLALLQSVGVDAIREESLARTERIIARLDAAGMEVATPRDPARRGGVVCVRHPDADELAQTLRAEGFVISVRGGLRIAPHYYNTDEEIDAFLDALVTLGAP
ncbi:MAG: aminotransferase class V-fold PLP-dependent enzyme [Myxococcota bacterium]